MRKINKLFIIISILLVISIGTLIFTIFRKNLISYVSKYTNAIVEANVINCLNNATTDAVNKYKEVFNDFIDLEYGENNQVQLMNVNMLYINCLQRDIASISLEYLIEYCKKHEIMIPSGAFVGGVLFSGKGDMIDVSIIPIGSTNVDYSVSFESVGINTTRFSLYIDINAACKIAVPFYTKDVNVTTNVLVVETIIQGQVPPYLIS